MTRIASLTVGLVMALGSALAAQDAASSPPKGLQAHLRSERLVPTATTGALPKSVQAALAALFQEPTLRMAEPGAPFQATDVLTPGQRLPFRRLVAAGCSDDHCLVYYEKGGFAHVFQIVVVAVSGETARLEWGGQAAGGLAGLEGARAALVEGKVLGQSRYW